MDRDPFIKIEILEALETIGREVADFFSAIPASAFDAGDSRHWGPAHHLEHLRMSRARVAGGFGMAARLPAHLTGHSMNYAEMRDRYLTGLAAAAAELAENNPLPPVLSSGTSQASLVEAFAADQRRLLDAASAWSEAELDARAMRHPILGMLTAREMLLFLLVHDRHHIDGVARSVNAARAGASEGRDPSAST